MISEARLRLYLSNSQIYEFYFGEFEIGRKYNSPFRRDPIPSFTFSFGEQGDLIWNDFGKRTTNIRDGIGFVAELYGISRKEAVQRIWKEIIIEKQIPKKRVILPRYSLGEDVDTHDLTSWELAYWAKYFIPEPILKRYQVQGVEYLSKNGTYINQSMPGDPVFVYWFEDMFNAPYKIYRPLSPYKGGKFRSNGNGSTIEGWKQLPKYGDRLYITKSMKDVMVMATVGECSCSPPSESNIAPIVRKAKELEQRFKSIFIIFDNDAPGIELSAKLHEQTGWPEIRLPDDYAKDISDLVAATQRIDYAKKILQNPSHFLIK